MGTGLMAGLRAFLYWGPIGAPIAIGTYPTRGKYEAGPRWPIVIAILGWPGLAGWLHNGVGASAGVRPAH